MSLFKIRAMIFQRQKHQHDIIKPFVIIHPTCHHPSIFSSFIHLFFLHSSFIFSSIFSSLTHFLAIIQQVLTKFHDALRASKDNSTVNEVYSSCMNVINRSNPRSDVANWSSLYGPEASFIQAAAQVCPTCSYISLLFFLPMNYK